jgi:hypothetical protein
MKISNERVLTQTQAWIKKAVIGLNLCPFAQAVYVKNQIRFVVSSADNVEALLAEVKIELKGLLKIDPQITDTTLIVHPHVLNIFSDFNEFLGVLDQVLIDMNFSGDLQIASFHPFYQFEGTKPEDISNYTNRSPFPIIQILRETSIENALKDFEEPDNIFKANIEKLQNLGIAGWKKLID